MWVLKVKVEAKNQFLGSIAVKHQVSLASFRLSSYKDDKWFYLVGGGFIFGEEKNKKAFVRDLEKQPRIIDLEFNNDFGILIIKEPLSVEKLWDPRIIQLSPIIINHKEKKHTWHFGSFDRKLLEKVLEISEKYFNAEVIKFRQEKISNISATRVMPELTKIQKRALEIAINRGYYNYPKKVKMEELAKEMGISYSTYQAHLKKAEGKIMPEVYREL